MSDASTTNRLEEHIEELAGCLGVRVISRRSGELLRARDNEVAYPSAETRQ